MKLDRAVGTRFIASWIYQYMFHVTHNREHDRMINHGRDKSGPIAINLRIAELKRERKKGEKTDKKAVFWHTRKI